MMSFPVQSKCRFPTWLMVGLILLCGPMARAQAPAPAAPAPTETVPPSPAPPPQGPSLSAPAPATPDALPPRAEAGGGEMKEIIARPALRLRSQSPWDEAHPAIRKAIDRLEAESRRLGLAREGNPMAHFIDSDDLGFTFEALVPLSMAPAPGTTFSEGIDAAGSPDGRSVVFPYEGANDEIDNAYEALTAWLDDKGLVSTGRYLEEYEVLPERGDDPGMKARIIIFLK